MITNITAINEKYVKGRVGLTDEELKDLLSFYAKINLLFGIRDKKVRRIRRK
jgi:hypothetical protein